MPALCGSLAPTTVFGDRRSPGRWFPHEVLRIDADAEILADLLARKSFQHRNQQALAGAGKHGASVGDDVPTAFSLSAAPI